MVSSKCNNCTVHLVTCIELSNSRMALFRVPAAEPSRFRSCRAAATASCCRSWTSLRSRSTLLVPRRGLVDPAWCPSAFSVGFEPDLGSGYILDTVVRSTLSTKLPRKRCIFRFLPDIRIVPDSRCGQSQRMCHTVRGGSWLRRLHDQQQRRVLPACKRE